MDRIAIAVHPEGPVLAEEPVRMEESARQDVTIAGMAPTRIAAQSARPAQNLR